MAPLVVNTYGSRNQKKRKARDKTNVILKEIGNSLECISMFDGSFMRSVKKTKGGKTGLAIKGVESTSTRRAKRKALKDFSQKLLKTDTFKHTVNKGQSGSHLSISIDTSYDTTFDRLRKAEPLQKLQPAAQCTSCPSSSDTSEQVESSNNCSLFPAPRITRQNTSSKKSSASLCSDVGDLASFRVTSTPKGVHRENKPYSPALSPIISVTHNKSEKVNEVKAQDITSMHSIERKVSLSSDNKNPVNTQNNDSLVPLFATFKAKASDVIELSSASELAQISVPADDIPNIDLVSPCVSQNGTTKDGAISSADIQAEVINEPISLSTENDDSLEIISIFKDLRTSFESRFSLAKDSTVFSKDIQIGRSSEHCVATSSDGKEAVENSDSKDLSCKQISLSAGFKGFDTQDLDMHSFAVVNRLLESNVQLLRGNKMSGTYYVSTDMFADFSDSVTSVRSDICSSKSSDTLASTTIPGFCDSVSMFSSDSNSIKSVKDILIQQPNSNKESNANDHNFSYIYCGGQTSQTGKCVSNRVSMSCDSMRTSISESKNLTNNKCQGRCSKTCVQDSTNASELTVPKHEHTSQTSNSAENKSSEVKTKLNDSAQETSLLLSATDAAKKTSLNLVTEASHQGIALETGRLSQPLNTQESSVKDRADTPSPGRLSCRRLSHLVIPQNKEVGNKQTSSFRKVYSSCAGRMSPCVENDDEEEDTLPALMTIPMKARQAVLHRCQQTEPIPFSEAFPDDFWDSCRKIGEGVYGEVFLSEAEDGGVFKVIPIEGDKIINEEPQKKYEEILSEIVIAMELSELRNGIRNNTSSFSEVKKCLCVKGRYPKPLVQLWEEYDADKGSENDCPVVFEDDQLYIILVLANGGQDLEAFCFSSADQALSVLKQTAFALAVAESALEFEHRDLHWGNVLIEPTSIKSVNFTINGEVFDVPTKGVKATIIDFTLSRMTYDGCCIFNDLARDPTLFTSEGDYQFEIYRLMRDSLMDDWQIFEPFTNLLWLHYLLHKMITMVNYRRRNTKIHQKGISEMKKLSEEILSFTSCSHFVSTTVLK